jgi:hypothetical protein
VSGRHDRYDATTFPPLPCLHGKARHPADLALAGLRRLVLRTASCRAVGRRGLAADLALAGLRRLVLRTASCRAVGRRVLAADLALASLRSLVLSRFTQYLASCSHCLAGLRRQVLTRPSGPGALALALGAVATSFQLVVQRPGFDTLKTCRHEEGGEGPPMPREPAYDDERSQDGEAKAASE